MFSKLAIKFLIGAAIIGIAASVFFWQQAKIEKLNLQVERAKVQVTALEEANAKYGAAYKEMAESIKKLAQESEELRKNMEAAITKIDGLEAKQKETEVRLSESLNAMHEDISSLPVEEQCPEAIYRSLELLRREIPE